MKNNIKNIFIITLLCTFLYYLFTRNMEISVNILQTLKMYITNVFPFLFPSIILTNLLIYNNIPY